MGLGMNATGWWRTIPALAEFRVLASTTAASGARARAGAVHGGRDGRRRRLGARRGGRRVRARLRHLARRDDRPGGRAAAPRSRCARSCWGRPRAAAPRTCRPSDDVVAFVRLRAQMTAEHAVWASVPINYARAHARRGRRPDRRGHRAAPALPGRGRVLQRPARGRQRPRRARRGHPRAHARRPRRGGRAIPPANGERLAADIPGAELSMWPGAAHLYFTDEPEVDRYVADWLSRH